MIRPIPDRLFVWNEVQRDEAQAPARHRRPSGSSSPARSASTSGSTGSRARGTSSRRGPGSTRRGRSSSTRAARRGRASRRSTSSAAGSRRCARTAGRSPSAGVLVRPHPKRPDAWLDGDLDDCPASSVFPRDGHAPTDDESKADYFDSIYHSGRRRRPEHERDDRGGDRRPAGADRARPRVRARPAGDAALPLPARGRRRAAHGRADARRARGAARAGDRRRGRRRRAPSAFVAEFVRPLGLDVAATPLFVDEVERFAAERRTAPAADARVAAAAAAAARPARRARGRSRTPARADGRRCGSSSSSPSPAYLRMYGSTIRLLAERGHDVLLCLRRPDKRRDPAGRRRGADGVEVVPPLPPPSRRVRGGGSSGCAPRPTTSATSIRASPARRTCARAWSKYLDGTPARADPTAVRLAPRAGRRSARRARSRAARAQRRAASTRALAGLAPDVVVVSPLIGRSSRQPAADRHGQVGPAARRSRSAFGVASWDHLTTKGDGQGAARPTLVWNELQRARRGRSCTAFRAASVVVTGAQLFDRGSTRRAEHDGGRARRRVVGAAARRTSSTSARRRTSRPPRRRSRSCAAGSRRCARAGPRRSASSSGRTRTTSRRGRASTTGSARVAPRVAAGAADDRGRRCALLRLDPPRRRRRRHQYQRDGRVVHPAQAGADDPRPTTFAETQEGTLHFRELRAAAGAGAPRRRARSRSTSTSCARRSTIRARPRRRLDDVPARRSSARAASTGRRRRSSRTRSRRRAMTAVYHFACGVAAGVQR